MRWRVWAESVAQDIGDGLRAIRRSPGFTTVAVASLAIGIGANTTMFSAIDRLLVRVPAHVHDADRIHRVYFELPRAEGSTGPLATQSYRVYAAIRDNVPALERERKEGAAAGTIGTVLE